MTSLNQLSRWSDVAPAALLCFFVAGTSQPDVQPTRAPMNWPSLPQTDGSGPEEAFLVRSITIDGLDKADLKPADLAGIEVQFQATPLTWGRPSELKVPMDRLLSPVSPLCLYASEVSAMSKDLVALVNKRGLVGVFVQIGTPGSEQAHPPDGNWHWQLHVARIAALKFVDNRAIKTPAADGAAITAGSPLKVGDHINRLKLDEYTATLKKQYGEVNVTVQAGEEVEEVVLTITLGQAN